MESPGDWYLTEDLSNLFLFNDSTIVNEPIFFDVVMEDLPDPDPAVVKDSKPIGKYKCGKCTKTFQFKSRLERHLITHQVGLP